MNWHGAAGNLQALGQVARPEMSIKRLEDLNMAEDQAKPDTAAHAPNSGAAELAELRQAALAFAQRLGRYGKKRAEDWGIDLEEGPEELIHEGERLARDLKGRLGRLEAKVEQNIREHPATWAGGLLGAVGFGIMLGMILRRRD